MRVSKLDGRYLQENPSEEDPFSHTLCEANAMYTRIFIAFERNHEDHGPLGDGYCLHSNRGTGVAALRSKSV